MTAVHNSLRACERKRRHRSYDSAKMAMRRMAKKGTAKPGLHTYFCENCTKKYGRPVYHLGCTTRWCK